MRNKNQRKHLMDLSSDMGLTTRKLQSQLVNNNSPKFFEVQNDEGKRVCQCGTEQDAQLMCSLNPGYTFTVHLLPPSPKTVDVKHVRLAPDLELPAQQILPESELQPFEI